MHGGAYKAGGSVRVKTKVWRVLIHRAHRHEAVTGIPLGALRDKVRAKAGRLLFVNPEPGKGAAALLAVAAHKKPMTRLSDLAVNTRRV